MLALKHIKRRKLVIALLFACATQISLGSFTGTVDEKAKAKYSLKNFNRNFYKKASPFSLTAGFQYKGIQVTSQQKDASGITYNSMMRFEKGNTTYIYPYKHKVTLSVFKTPTPPS
ncbi:MAG TPA: hypothetical protein VF540_11985, partial [Segetibacter sp.]